MRFLSIYNRTPPFHNTKSTLWNKFEPFNQYFPKNQYKPPDRSTNLQSSHLLQLPKNIPSSFQPSPGGISKHWMNNPLLQLLNNKSNKMHTARSGSVLYKSQHSPYYSTFSPQMERLIQVKIDLINRRPHGGTHGRQQSRRMVAENPKEMANFNSLRISAKSLQKRTLTFLSPTQQRRSLTRLNSRPKTAATIIRCQSLPRKSFRTFEAREQQNEELQLRSADKWWQRRQV